MDPKYCIVHECEKEKGRLLSQSLEVEPYMPFPGIEPIYVCYWKWTPIIAVLGSGAIYALSWNLTHIFKLLYAMHDSGNKHIYIMHIEFSWKWAPICNARSWKWTPYMHCMFLEVNPLYAMHVPGSKPLYAMHVPGSEPLCAMHVPGSEPPVCNACSWK